MSYYFIAIGGSGAKVLESLTHLSAAGAFPNEEKLYVMNIDPDVGNGNLARSTKSLQCYEVFQNLKIGYHSPLFRTKVVLSKPFTWNPSLKIVPAPINPSFMLILHSLRFGLLTLVLSYH